MKVNNSTVIAIAGTVGVGKASLAQKLAEKLNFKTSFENVENNPYLKKYYNDFNRWGFHLQVFFLTERFKEERKIFADGGGYVQDRSIYEDLEIFAKLNFENGTMNEDDYNTYKSLFEAMGLNPFLKKPDIIIYLEGSFEEILSRIKSRGREMEIQTEEKYWEDLHSRYEKWINNFNHTPVLKINIENYDVSDSKSIDDIIEKIEIILESRE